MTNWERYWSRYPTTVGRTEYLKQVNSTVGGKPISREQFQLSVTEICDGLELDPGDTLLDLCCGNGLVTVELARRCKVVVGVDFSEPLLRVGRADHQPPNVTYVKMDVLRLDALPHPRPAKFNKVLMAAAAQHFRVGQFASLLRSILRFEPEVVLFTDVLDRSRKWHFYNTGRRRLRHFVEVVTGRDAMGTWFRQSDLRSICEELGLQCEFFRSADPLYAYRFNIKVRAIKSEGNG